MENIAKEITRAILRVYTMTPYGFNDLESCEARQDAYKAALKIIRHEIKWALIAMRINEMDHNQNEQ